MARLIGQRQSLVTVNILYWMPDYNNIVQELWWQTCDVNPHYPRVNSFLKFWKNEVDAVVKEIYLMDHSSYGIRNAIKIEDIMDGYGKAS